LTWAIVAFISSSTSGVSLHFTSDGFHTDRATAKQYGDVLSVKALGQTMIVINSPTLLRQVLDRHASASANRPHSIIAGMIVDDGLNMGLTLQS